MGSRLLGIVLLLICPAITACDRDGATGQDRAGASRADARTSDGVPRPDRKPVIETITVQAGPSSAELSLAGKIAYGEDGFSRLSSALSGRVLEVHAKLGDLVRAGQSLITIESPEIAAAYSEFVKEHSELSYAKRSYALAKDLYAIKAMALKDLKQAENDFIKAQAEFRRARERLLALQVPAAELAKPLTGQRITSQYHVRSPISGKVMERYVTPGQTVSGDPAQVLLVIGNLDAVQMIADLYEKDLSLVRVGQPGTVTVEAYPDTTFPARITAIGDVVDPSSRTIKVRASLQNPDHLLKPEMFARLSVKLGDSVAIPLVPREAVLEIDGTTHVYVEQEQGRYVRRAVRIGTATGPQVPVLDGLAVGERVVTKGAILLKGKGGAVPGAAAVPGPGPSAGPAR